MTKISIKVIVDSAHHNETEALCASLTKLGLQVETALPEIGVIFGSGDASLLPRLSATKGVESAMAETGITLPPASDKLPQ